MHCHLARDTPFGSNGWFLKSLGNEVVYKKFTWYHDTFHHTSFKSWEAHRTTTFSSPKIAFWRPLSSLTLHQHEATFTFKKLKIHQWRKKAVEILEIQIIIQVWPLLMCITVLLSHFSPYPLTVPSTPGSPWRKMTCAQKPYIWRPIDDENRMPILSLASSLEWYSIAISNNFFEYNGSTL